MKKIQTRKLEETSWLAQVIKDKMNVEADKMGIYPSARWHCLHTLKIIVNEADNEANTNIYYSKYNDKRSIIICDIPDLSPQHGTDYDRSGMQAKLRGLAARYKDDDGNYIINVLTTHDLNTATIKDVSELLYQLGTH